MDLKEYIRIVPDFPKAGVSFKDVSTLFKDKSAFKLLIDLMLEDLKDKQIDIVVSPEARGFSIGAALAYLLNAGFVPARKPGKLPAPSVTSEYRLEYGINWMQIHEDAITPGQRVAVVDDILATGGTTSAVCRLVEKLNGDVACVSFAIELTELNGREKLSGYDISTVIRY